MLLVLSRVVGERQGIGVPTLESGLCFDTKTSICGLKVIITC